MSLLLLRGEALTQIVEQLYRMKDLGLKVPDSDYSKDSLAVETLRLAQDSANEYFLKGGILAKLKRHIELIDKFSGKLMIETGVQEEFFDRWLGEIETMKKEAENNIQNSALRKHTLSYIKSWETFLSMYLMFKWSSDGTI